MSRSSSPLFNEAVVNWAEQVEEEVSAGAVSTLKNFKRAEEIWADYIHSLRESGTFATLFPNHPADDDELFVRGAQTPTFQALIGFLIFGRDSIRGHGGAPSIASVSTLWASLRSLWRAKTASALDPVIVRQVWLQENGAR